MSDSPKTSLLRGAQIVGAILGDRFAFEFRGDGRSSSGYFAWGEFVDGARRLELHFTRDLGPVRYHLGECCVSHAHYMRELGVAAEYPGFRTDPFDGFVALARDLGFASDFLTGNGDVLRRAARAEAAQETARAAELMAGYVGDERVRETLRSAFREGKYEEAIAAAGRLRYPERLARSEERMLEIARRRVGA